MRNQRAFKEPTESEIDQIAEWLRPDTYEAVLEGIRRPRPEGSTVSRKPFELVWVCDQTGRLPMSIARSLDWLTIWQ